MIHPVSGVQPQRTTSYAATLKDCSPLGDEFRQSEEPLGLLQPQTGIAGITDGNNAKPTEKKKHAWIRQSITLGMGVGTLAAGVVGSPAMAAAAEQVQVRPKAAGPADPALQLLLSSRAARGESVPVDLAAEYRCMSPETAAHLQSLPVDVQTQYFQIEKPARNYLSRQLHGKSSVVGFPVSNRKAFIKGNVIGVDVFGIARSDVHSKVRRGEVPAALEAPVKRFLTQLGQLSKTQREQIVLTLEGEFPGIK